MENNLCVWGEEDLRNLDSEVQGESETRRVSGNVEGAPRSIFWLAEFLKIF